MNRRKKEANMARRWCKIDCDGNMPKCKVH